MKSRKFLTALVVVIGLGWVFVSAPAHAQFLGHNIPGDFGLTSGTQPDPGIYLSALYLGYTGDTLRDRNGNNLGISPSRDGDLDVNGYGLGLWWVSDFKIFGGNYSLMIWPSWTNNKMEIPILGQEAKTSTGFSDLYIQPINLGWHTERADFTAGLGVFLPTGKYDATADDNLGLGMYSFEVFAGTTVYLDKAKTWQFATTAFFETHSEKEDTDVRVGNIITLEGGLGKFFMGGAINVGIAYYAQWKVSSDDLGDVTIPPAVGQFVGKNRGYGFGPEITLPIASKSKLYGFINARYLWETGVRSSVEGEMFLLTLTFPIPSIPLQ